MIPGAPKVRPGSARAWLLASRPKTLTAAIAPVLAGTACAFHAGSFRAGPAAAALAGALLIQIGSNIANDLFDFEKGTDTADRLGPARAAQFGLLTTREMRAGMWIVFGLAALFGLYLTAVAGWGVVAIGLFSILSAIAYTGGPRPLGYIGLGDLFVFLFFGFVAVAGTAFVQCRFVPGLAWIVSLPIGALATAILVVNNVRDIETDRRTGKMTIAARFGRKTARVEYGVLLLLSYAVPLLLVLTGRVSPLLLLPFATLPLAAREAATVFTVVEGPVLNGALSGTARLLFLHGLLLSAGIAADRWLATGAGP